MGIGDRLGGRVKEAAGDLTGSEALRREGIEDERRAERTSPEQAEAERRQARADRKAEEVE